MISGSRKFKNGYTYSSSQNTCPRYALVETAGRHAGVVVRGQTRAGLEHVGDVQPQDELHARLAWHLDVADVPQRVPPRRARPRSASSKAG